jgi:hypothetical protein
MEMMFALRLKIAKQDIGARGATLSRNRFRGAKLPLSLK